MLDLQNRGFFLKNVAFLTEDRIKLNKTENSKIEYIHTPILYILAASHPSDRLCYKTRSIFFSYDVHA